ncbi:uncharacterized protein LOC121428771 [Lytechinus variegatus]|uniref:uncharacterized protein LOC121428771 n=1 Tax=Lytechinus variegatus TaxID=7654 RepID=UPI001BB21E26|nr:uncharacterized protein LOC121428771 [Lytechinus variegatus]
MNSARYAYTFVTLPYSGKPTEAPTADYITGTEEIVQYLVNKMKEYNHVQGRNITMDRFYTSLSLADWLFTEVNATIIGTMMINRKGIPAEVKPTAGRDEFSYEVYWNVENQQMSLHSYMYVVRTKSTGPRNVLVLTTMKPILGTTTDGGKHKPAIFKLYDFTKGGTDIVDQRMQTYTTKAKSNRWTMVAFYYLLDTCRVNAQSILSMNQGLDPRKASSFEFGWDLVESLVVPYIQQRPTVGLPTSVLRKMKFFTGEPVPRERIALAFDKVGSRKRCTTCVDDSHGEGHKKEKPSKDDIAVPNVWKDNLQDPLSHPMQILRIRICIKTLKHDCHHTHGQINNTL